jgi:hypothetical protein
LRGFFFAQNNGKPVDAFYRNPHNCFINLDGAYMNTYQVTVRTAGHEHVFSAIAASSADAFEDAATKFADVPCGITVMGKVRP